jgi:hypothetical protein
MCRRSRSFWKPRCCCSRIDMKNADCATTFVELLDPIRLSYVKLLAQEILSHDGISEPALRRETGALACEGRLDLPCRVDCVPRTGDFAGALLTFDATDAISFDDVNFGCRSTGVSVNVFTWDWLTVTIYGLPISDCENILKKWFLSYFDEHDENALGPDNLAGVVHFMSDPIIKNGACECNIDLGSVTTRSLEDLVYQLSDNGAVSIRLA